MNWAIGLNPMPTFVVYVRRTPQALLHVLSLFHRRAIEIEKLTAERTEEPNVLRATITIDADTDKSGLIEANLHKLVDVLAVEGGDQ